MEANPKKGTTTVGIVCKDGIVLAADKRATAGTRISKGTRIDKVLQISDHMAMTTAGLVSDIQLFTKIIRSQLMLLKMRKTKEPSAKEAVSLLGNLAYSNIRRPSMIPGIVGFLFAGHDKTGSSLYEVSFDGTVLKVDTFAADGSGSSIALGVLETLYKENMTTTEATEIAVRALKSAIERDSATGNGIDVAVINANGVKYVEHKTVHNLFK